MIQADKRMDRWARLSVIAILVIGAFALAACGGGRSGGVERGSATNGTISNGSAGTTAVQVSLDEMQIRMPSAPRNAGELTFVVRNDGHTQHDFVLKGNGVNYQTRMLEPGESETLTVNLVPGTYDYLCNVPAHAALGMSGRLTLQ